MLIGTVTKQEGIWWSAHCDIAGIFTQGKSKADAMRALADAFEDVINRPGFKVTVAALDGDEVRVEASDPALLQRCATSARHHLSLADVAKRINASSRNAYARPSTEHRCRTRYGAGDLEGGGASSRHRGSSQGPAARRLLGARPQRRAQRPIAPA
jgi:hypothetical protein